jgi:hypothetical protein
MRRVEGAADMLRFVEKAFCVVASWEERDLPICEELRFRRAGLKPWISAQPRDVEKRRR